MTSSLLDILNQSVNSEHGIAVNVKYYHAAKRLRRMLYAQRERLRKQGVVDYNQLSFIPQTNGELWLVKRDSVVAPKAQYLFDRRPLLETEAPSIVRARGKRRSGLLFQFLEKTFKDEIDTNSPAKVNIRGE